MSMAGPTPTGPEPFPAPGTSPNLPEVPPGLGPLEDPVTEPDVIDPGFGMPAVPGQEPDVPGAPGDPMVA